MVWRGFFKLGSKRRFWALKRGRSSASLPGPACSGHIWRGLSLDASPACGCFQAPLSVSENDTVGSPSGTAPGTAAMPG